MRVDISCSFEFSCKWKKRFITSGPCIKHTRHSVVTRPISESCPGSCVFIAFDIWTAAWHDQQNDISAQWRLRLTSESTKLEREYCFFTQKLVKLQCFVHADSIDWSDKVVKEVISEPLLYKTVISCSSLRQGWQSTGQYAYWPDQWSLLVLTGHYWSIGGQMVDWKKHGRCEDT